MNSSLSHVLEAAKSLPEPERVELIDALIATLEPEDAAPLDDAWLAEIDRRSREFDAGLVQTIPWEEVKERARRRVHANG
jgi:putative addiction module component (TIGR02574 family)